MTVQSSILSTSGPRQLPAVGQTVHLLGALLTFRATSAETDGNFSLVEALATPGQMTPSHVHHHDDEAFYVLEGAFDFRIGGQTMRSGPGSFHFVSRGTPHSFNNAGDKPARMLILNQPAGLHETFFLEAGDAVADASVFPPPSPPDFQRLGQAAARAGVEMLPPA